MKVVVNAVGYVGQAGGAGGAGVFLQHLVAQLSAVAEVDVLVAPNARTFPEGRRNGRFIELPHLSPGILRQLRSGPTVVVDPFGCLPCAPFPEDMAFCAVVHDLMHLERPHFFTAAERRQRSALFRDGLQRADAVVTFTEDQARAVRQSFPGTRPVVIPHLPYMVLEPEGTAAEAEAALPPGLGRFVLFPAVRWPHKNHKTLVEAFGAYVRQSGSDLRLVMTGGPCAESRFSYLPQAEAVSDRIIDLGRVSDAAIRALFARAEAVLFPTQYEGFGIPVLEAAALGKMVVASRLPVFDEILGPANYRGVEDTLCHLRWMEALAEVEKPAARERYEAASRRLGEAVVPERFLRSFETVLRDAAERYASPAHYPSRATRHGDRITARHAAGLRFTDIYGAAVAERGAPQPVLGADPSPQPSYIFRSAGGPEVVGRRSCLRAEFALPAAATPGTTTLFSAWVRLHREHGIDALRWSVNDGYTTDLLPDLRQGHWHLCRLPVPRSGYIDFRGFQDDQSEVPGFEVEIHDPCILEFTPMADPVEAPLAPPGLTAVVAALDPEAAPPAALAAEVAALNAALNAGPSRGTAPVQWIAVVPGVNPAALPAEAIPPNLRFLTVGPEPFERADAGALLTPYQPVARLVLLEAGDLALCRTLPEALAALGAAAAGPGVPAPRPGFALPLPPAPPAEAFWRPAERGRVLDVVERIGQPVPLLDPGVVEEGLSRAARRRRPRFAVIETDRTSEISHHGTVTGLFLKGAEALGWQPVLGLHGDPQAPVARSAGRSEDGIEVWEGFGTQVYGVGSAEAFAEELEGFVEATGLGPDDVVFMHSLAPQILLGAARYLAGAPPSRAPRFAMRFFSTAEAMRGHRLSYAKILRSILGVRAVRERMRFFCESRNLVAYYEEQVGVRFPLLLNPEHPGLALARDSAWFDPGLGGGKVPMLAYFGEAREEKGFDLLPGILSELLAAEALADHRFLVQTGSNRQNETPKMARAKAALAALRARHPDRLRCFESVETAEQLYFLMKHAQGVLAPYRPEGYGKRGTGITLEALQMGLDVYALVETDLYATFRGTGRMIGAPDDQSFARTVLRHRTGAEPPPPADPASEEVALLRLPPEAVCERLLAACDAPAPAPPSPLPAGIAPAGPAPTILWVGNDTFGEGNSAVYASQKQALAALGRDCLELFVPWPDRNWSGADATAFDARLYGFDSGYESHGLAWVARPRFTPEQIGVLEEIERQGPTYGRLRDLNRHFAMPRSLRRAIAGQGVTQTLLNYAHLLPIVADTMPLERIVCETHDVMAYQHAVRRGDGVSLAEKIEEFSDLARLPRIVSISAAERREIAGACGRSRVEWRLPPFVPEPLPADRTAPAHAEWVRTLATLGGMPEEVARPTPLMLRTYFARQDLQALFPLNHPAGRAAFFRWWFFFGQLELGAEAFGLSPRQVDWVLRGEGGEDGRLPGMLRMLLAGRDDLRRAFVTPGGTLRAEALGAWAQNNLEREYGPLAPAPLAEQAERFFARAGAAGTAMLAPGGAPLQAVLEAGPTFGALKPAEAEALVQRLAAVEAVDLTLVGSGHPSNVESFRWFLDEVWLKAFAPKGRNLFVLGSACEALRGAYSHRSLFLLGRCERIGPMLAAARACPLPVVVGSGSPIKTIPAMALNGAVTITEHIDRAFGLAEHGIAPVGDAREFTDDLWSLLADEATRRARQERSARYVAENLGFEGYARFWGGMLA